MWWSVLKTLPALAVLQQLALAAPVDDRDTLPKVVQTTKTSFGQTIDWIRVDSQGKIASPPPGPLSNSKPTTQLSALTSALESAITKGPKGTVPVLREGFTSMPMKRLPGAAVNGTVGKRDSSYAGTHWYASSGQSADNLGGSAVFSLFKAYVQYNGDFSLLQTAVIRNNAVSQGSGSQTVEAGWINYPDQVQAPHLFSFYTTNGYASNADNVGGWNREVAGWVQVDDTIYPGVAFTPLSTVDGSQYEVTIGYQLFQGNWWLYAVDRWIGYYPASLFSQYGNSAAATLATRSDMIDYYGEVYNSQAAMTTTDMGSGQFPEQGYGKSGYIRNMIYVDTNGTYQFYDGSKRVLQSDINRYRIKTFFKSGTNWGSYCFLGGPGAGGVSGG
ncbi:hypothetical protein HIM_01845 [Hirsutella minnesotensis 3608]|nr:hypothetical protein HIM_01845 [Hirsutella minnesotensis 3608]